MNRFKVENETVLDEKTNLMWMQKPLEGVFTFDEAIAIKKEFAGFDDWRMPTIDELVSIVNCQSKPSYFEVFVSADESDMIWSSSPYVDDTYYAWYFNFSYGDVSYGGRYYAFQVQLVRDCASTEVTEAMAAAGRQIASDLLSASVSKSMGGLGGSKTWEEWANSDVKNRDIILAYLEEDIDSVTAIYKAMQRAQR